MKFGKIESFDGFVVVDKDYYGRVWHVHLWNPDTWETKNVACEDTEYGSDGFSMGLVSYDVPEGVRRAMLGSASFGGSADVRAKYDAYKAVKEEERRKKCFEDGIVCVGFTVEVYKGRKYPIGTTGVVKGFWDYKDRYGRVVANYVVLEDGKRVPEGNVRPIAM